MLFNLVCLEMSELPVLIENGEHGAVVYFQRHPPAAKWGFTSENDTDCWFHHTVIAKFEIFALIAGPTRYAINPTIVLLLTTFISLEPPHCMLLQHIILHP